MSVRLLATSFVLILLIVLAGCSDDTDCPNCPDDGDPIEVEASIQNVWPNADGNVWIHDLAVRGFEGDPDDVIDPDDPVPDLPSMETLHARLAEPVPFEPLGDSEGLYRMSFDGDVVTESDVTAQNFREELFTPEYTRRVISSHDQRLRELVLSVRPDLRLDQPPKPRDKDIGDQLDPPILMGGYAFEANDDGIYGYGDLNTDYSWLYLESDLSVGHEFSIQLVPDLVDDIFLDGRIWSIGDLEVNGRTYESCVECFYVIDFGITIATDEEGNVLFSARSYLFGSVHYAPGFGPVLCHQRIQPVGGALQGEGPGILDYLATISGLDVEMP